MVHVYLVHFVVQQGHNGHWDHDYGRELKNWYQDQELETDVEIFQSLRLFCYNLSQIIVNWTDVNAFNWSIELFWTL